MCGPRLFAESLLQCHVQGGEFDIAEFANDQPNLAPWPEQSFESFVLYKFKVENSLNIFKA